MHPNVERVARILKELGADSVPIELAEPAPTAVAAADQLGCPVGAIANSLLFDADGEPLLVLTSGAHRVDTGLVAALTGAGTIARPDAEFVRRHSGFPIGGVAPVGHPRPLPTLVDRWLEQHETVWAAAGHPHWVFATTAGELAKMTGGAVADVGR